jgi:GH25 family lysozyme M1 (1,4-beta-N-acetylmuramidase)
MSGQTADPGQPYLFVDLYSGDDGRLAGKTPDWTTLAATPNYCGAILKAWEGVAFDDGGWFQKHWPAVRDAGGAGYGATWFRGAYLFLKFLEDGAAQADAYLAAIDAAGGWDSGDILPIIDVEQGGPGNTNQQAGKQQVIDCVSACAAQVKSKTGRRVMLYGRGAMRDLGITDRMGCDVAWNPAYTMPMVTHGLEAFGLDNIALWQYGGDGTAAIPTLPHSVPNFGPCDLSVHINGAAAPTLESLKTALIN